MQNTERSSTPMWLILLIVLLFIFNAIPFLAPLFMKLGWELPAYGIYTAYSALCHQMAQRSFFLFGGPAIHMTNIADLPLALDTLTDGERMLALRRFAGNESIGWKVAWSDRMVYMYVTPLLATIGYAFLRRIKKVKPLPLWAFGLLLLPMAIDGGTHMMSDLAGIGQGFRYTNDWLTTLTGGMFPATFYVGDAFGSFNSGMRLISGVSFGIAVAGLFLPAIDDMSTVEDKKDIHITQTTVKGSA